MDVPAFKVASFELVDLPLIREMAGTGQADDHVDRHGHRRTRSTRPWRAARDAGAEPISRSSSARAPTRRRRRSVNLRAIPTMAERWGVPIGLSDHTKGIAVPAAAVALGATLVEKHVTLSHADATPDEQFSLDLTEFAAMVDAIRTVERAMGSSRIGPTDDEAESRRLRRSLFVVEDVVAGEPFTARNLRSIRPAVGMHTREYEPRPRAARRGPDQSGDAVEPGSAGARIATLTLGIVRGAAGRSSPPWSR